MPALPIAVTDLVAGAAPRGDDWPCRGLLRLLNRCRARMCAGQHETDHPVAAMNFFLP